MGLKRNKKKSKRATRHAIPEADEIKGPRILVINRGSVGPIVPHLMSDIQDMLSPNVVRSIKVLRSSRVKDIMAAAGPLNISHAVVFTRTDSGLYLKLCTLPRGPTITFGLLGYSLSTDVLKSQKRAFNLAASYQRTAPCLMMNNLQPHSGPKYLQLVASSMLQIFPKIVPTDGSCRHIRRCCLLHYDEESEELDLRHYMIQLSNAATARLVSKLANSKKIPDLHNYEEIEDALNRDGAASESEAEEDCKVDMSRLLEEGGGSKKPISTKSSVKMRDAGPRLCMKVQKVESGMLGGEVLYNRTEKRTPEEIEQLRALREKKKKEKMARKQRQEANISKKKDLAEEHKDRCLKGMPEDLQERAKKNKELKKEEEAAAKKDEEEDGEAGEGASESEEDEDEAQYYKDAVGDLPEGITFSNRMKRRREKDGDDIVSKKKKVESAEQQKIDKKRAKAHEKYKKLNEKKQKRPRAYGKRLVKKMRRQVKERVAQKAAAKSKEMPAEV